MVFSFFKTISQEQAASLAVQALQKENGFERKAYPHTTVKELHKQYAVTFLNKVCYVPLEGKVYDKLTVFVSKRGRINDVERSVADNNHPARPSKKKPVFLPTAQEKETLAFIDQALKKNGDFGKEANLSTGVTGLQKNNSVVVKDRKSHWWVTAEPLSGIGYYYGFFVEKKTGKVNEPLTAHVELPKEKDIKEVKKYKEVKE
jgi:hypothetical protein